MIWMQVNMIMAFPSQVSRECLSMHVLGGWVTVNVPSLLARALARGRCRLCARHRYMPSSSCCTCDICRTPEAGVWYLLNTHTHALSNTSGPWWTLLKFASVKHRCIELLFFGKKPQYDITVTFEPKSHFSHSNKWEKYIPISQSPCLVNKMAKAWKCFPGHYSGGKHRHHM